MQIGPIVESPLREASLEALFERYQKADAPAATELIQRLSPDLLRFFLAQEATRMEADDLLQNTWLRIHKARHTYRAGAPVLSWVFAIAKHVRVDGYRKRRRIQQYEKATENLPECSSSQDVAPAEVPMFESLIADLPESQREVLIMLKVNGLSLEEVALATSSTVGAVKQKASRAYAKLRKLLSSSGSWGTTRKEATGTR
ncbi:MAG TPA: RNA polymerase sigma factor [Bryobacteraceae bacterium]|nr:RNA polymerase sigma factor [Bryobacteraceae bacterium]